MRLKSPAYIDRIEKKYQIGISESDVAELWRDLSSYLPRYGLTPVQQITSIGSVYFDNPDYDLLRYTLLIERGYIHVRLRAYEYFGVPPEPISDYWMEVKIKEMERTRKKRLRIKRENFAEFFVGKDAGSRLLDYNQEGAPPEVIRSLYRESQETLVTLGLKPILLVTYKRVAFQNESERISLDWDTQYYHVGTSVYFYDSWKYLTERPVGKAEKTFLEFKYPQGNRSAWIEDLQRRYPIWEERNHSKFVEGMGFLFQRPLRHHREANSFIRMIEDHTGDGKHLL